MKKLHRFPEDSKIAGVCAGLGDYFDLDPVLFRLFFLVSLLFGGHLAWVVGANERVRLQFPNFERR